MDEASDRGGDLLKGGSPKEILARLLSGDPLELRARCRERLHAKALLVSLDRLQLRAVARIAHAAPRWRGEPPLQAWVEETIDHSTRELMEEDVETVRSGIPQPGPGEGHYAFLSSLLGIEPHLCPRACVAFNALHDSVRRTFFALVVEGTRLNRYVAEGNGTPQEVKASLERAFQALGLADSFRRRRLDDGGYDDL
jgi:hypothetical protein